MKKLFALLLAVLMVMSMSFTALADEDPSPSASPAENDQESENLYDRTFTAYQIFTATNISDDGELGNLNWGKNINKERIEELITLVLPDWNKEEAPTAADVAAALTNGNAKQVAQLIFDAVLTGEGTNVVSGETLLPIGYYLIVDETIPTEENPLTPNVYNLSVLKVSDNETPVKVVSKVSVPKVDKKILIERGEKVDKVNISNASIGDVVKYEIVGTLPSNLSDYKTYFYQFTDTLSKGLTFNGDIKVTMGNTKEVTEKFEIKSDVDDETGETSIVIRIADIKKLEGVSKDTEIVVTYTATLNADAVIASTGNPNEVDLTYSNSPNKSGEGEPGGPEHPTGTTPKKKVVTFTSELKIIKTDDEGNKLPGVEFTLSGNGVNIVVVTEEQFVEDANGEYWKLKDGTYTKTAPVTAEGETNNAADYESTTVKYKLETVVTPKTGTVSAEGKEKEVKGTVAEDGTVTFTGLGAGEYTISETKTLPGYNTIDPISFVIRFDAETSEFKAYDTADADEESKVILLNSDKANTFKTTIINKKGVTLPETGGIGTTIFYVVGAAMVIMAGVLLIVRKRSQNND